VISIKPIQFGVILQPENAALIAEYGAECSIAAVGPINPQADMYAALERAGVSQCFAVLCDGRLIGFANVLVSVIPHYGRKVATVESLFVAKAYRNTRAGASLMAVIEGHAMAAGCAGILYSAPTGGKLERLLSRQRKYQRTNSVFFRSLP
jgi:GNAT superfamily N-acetyltransferase